MKPSKILSVVAVGVGVATVVAKPNWFVQLFCRHMYFTRTTPGKLQLVCAYCEKAKGRGWDLPTRETK